MIKNRLSLFKNCIYAREGEVKVAHNEFWYIFLQSHPLYANSQIKRSHIMRAPVLFLGSEFSIQRTLPTIVRSWVRISSN
jgi:hypothetical protein